MTNKNSAVSEHTFVESCKTTKKHCAWQCMSHIGLLSLNAAIYFDNCLNVSFVTASIYLNLPELFHSFISQDIFDSICQKCISSLTSKEKVWQ